MILEEIYKLSKESKTIDGQISLVIIDELLEKRSFDLTVTELGAKTGCSQPSASRYAKNLGVKSYKKLVNIINEEAPIYFAREDKQKDTLASAKREIVDSVIETLNNFSGEEIHKIARLILDANKINVVGMGGNRTIKQEIEHKLSQVGKHIMFATDWHQQMINLSYMHQDDLVIIISYSGDKDETNKIADEAQKRKIPLVIFSGNFQSKIVQKATHYVKIYSKDPKYRSFSFSSKPPVVAAWEIIFKEIILLDDVAQDIVEAWRWKKDNC